MKGPRISALPPFPKQTEFGRIEEMELRAPKFRGISSFGVLGAFGVLDVLDVLGGLDALGVLEALDAFSASNVVKYEVR